MTNYGIQAGNTDTRYSQLKIILSGRLTSSNVSTIFTIKHGLGYIPAFIVTASGAVSQDANDRYLCSYRNAGGEQFIAYSDSENLYIDTSTGGTESNIFYYIFGNQGS